jgi:homospermidine synthase
MSPKVDISKNKILFMGYGAVAKCVWYYFDDFFEYDIQKVYVIDKCTKALYGPKLNKIPKKNITIKQMNSYTFDDYVDSIQLDVGDVIIDLTFCSDTYYFIRQCLKRGINYINTSIEDSNDDLFGTSIDLQQQLVDQMYVDFKKKNKVQSNILIEFGQNPGLIQHYILYALNELNKRFNKNKKDDYDIKSLIKAIDNYKIGTILMSEIDNMRSEHEFKYKKDMIYNTWCVSGLLAEGVDKAELVYGNENKYIKPNIPLKLIDYKKTQILRSKSTYNDKYTTFFLNPMGINCLLNSICPVKINNKIHNEKYEGRLIHHGETFECAKLFGKKAPFMSYVYKINKHAEHSIRKFFKENKTGDSNDLTLIIHNMCDSFRVFDNTVKGDNKILGCDSIGCTILCGDKDIEQIFWCGTVLTGDTNNPYTATVTQVAAGVLSGLSYIMEPKNKGKGLLLPCDLDTKYILEKSIPYLGDFFFTEIPINQFDKKMKFFQDTLIVL